MATGGEEIYKIIARVEGEDKVRNLKEAIEQEEASLNAVIQSLKASGNAHFQANAGVQAHAQTIQQLNGDLRAAQSQVVAAGGSLGKWGQAITQAGYAADDLQYGFRGIANNIQPILSAIPGLGALAGPLSIAAIAAFQLYTHWDQLLDAFGIGIPQPALSGMAAITKALKDAKAEMEALGEKARLTAGEFVRLGELRGKVATLERQQKEAQELEKIEGGRTEQEEKVARGFEKAVKESGGGARKLLEDALGNLADEQGKVYSEALVQVGTPEEIARGLFLKAGAGNVEAREEIRKQLEAGFPGQETAFGKALVTTSPEEEARKKAAKDRADAAKKAGDAADRDAEAEAAATERDDAENLAEFQRRRAKIRQKAADVADTLLKGPLGDALTAGTATEADVRKGLEAQGFSAGTAAKRAGLVRSIAQEKADKDAREKATELGTDLAGGREALIAERQAERDRKAKSDLDRRVTAAKESAPGLSDLIEGQVEGTARLGGNVSAVQASLIRAFTARFGGDVAKQLVGEGSADAQKQLLADALKEPERRTSEIIASPDFARAIQAGVGGEKDIPAKQLEKLSRSVQLLEQLVRKPTNGGVVLQR